jgi:cytidine deaminase
MHPIQNLVGTALLLDNGQTVLGSNQECSISSGLCAERVSLQAGAVILKQKFAKWLLPRLQTQ